MPFLDLQAYSFLFFPSEYSLASNPNEQYSNYAIPKAPKGHLLLFFSNNPLECILYTYQMPADQQEGYSIFFFLALPLSLLTSET